MFKRVVSPATRSSGGSGNRSSSRVRRVFAAALFAGVGALGLGHEQSPLGRWVGQAILWSINADLRRRFEADPGAGSLMQLEADSAGGGFFFGRQLAFRGLRVRSSPGGEGQTVRLPPPSPPSPPPEIQSATIGCLRFKLAGFSAGWVVTEIEDAEVVLSPSAFAILARLGQDPMFESPVAVPASPPSPDAPRGKPPSLVSVRIPQLTPRYPGGLPRDFDVLFELLNADNLELEVSLHPQPAEGAPASSLAPPQPPPGPWPVCYLRAGTTVPNVSAAELPGGWPSSVSPPPFVLLSPEELRELPADDDRPAAERRLHVLGSSQLRIMDVAAVRWLAGVTGVCLLPPPLDRVLRGGRLELDRLVLQHDRRPRQNGENDPVSDSAAPTTVGTECRYRTAVAEATCEQFPGELSLAPTASASAAAEAEAQDLRELSAYLSRPGLAGVSPAPLVFRVAVAPGRKSQSFREALTYNRLLAAAAKSAAVSQEYLVSSSSSSQ